MFQIPSVTGLCSLSYFIVFNHIVMRNAELTSTKFVSMGDSKGIFSSGRYLISKLQRSYNVSQDALSI